MAQDVTVIQGPVSFPWNIFVNSVEALLNIEVDSNEYIPSLILESRARLKVATFCRNFQ
jgi:hypothetical protein